MIDVSIIIPHYNSPKELNILLKTIPNRSNFQTIIIDDKSSDKLTELKEVYNKFNNKNTIFLRNDTNKKGAGVCRNIGLDFATGKWILFADSDDFFLNNFYKKINPFFESDYDVIFFSPTSIELDSKEISDRHIEFENLINDYNNSKSQSKLDLKYKFVVPWSKMISRSFIDYYNIRFDEVIASNDVMFSTKVGHYSNNIFATTNTIYCVTRNKGSLSVNMNKNVYYTRLKVFINQFNFLKSHLSKVNFNSLNINGQWIMINAFKYKLNFKELIKVYLKLKNNDIKIFEWNFLNPVFLLKKIAYYTNRYQKQKRYYDK